MQITVTNGLAMYQQTINHTPGLGSSIWVGSTSERPPILVQLSPIQIEEKHKESPEKEAA